MKNKLDICISFFATAVFTLTLSLTACNQDTKNEDSRKVAENKNEAKFDDTSEDDAKFLVDVASFNLEQAELGKLTAVKSHHADVKDFGQMMQEAHNIKMRDLNDFATSKQISVPVSLTDDNKEDYNALNKRDIEDFDKVYLESVVEDHKEAIAHYTTRMGKTGDGSLKKWINMELASLREHLDVAMNLQSRLNLK